MKDDQRPAAASLPSELPAPGASSSLEVSISADLASVDVMHHGRMVTIMRNQDQGNSINPEFARTSRKCPPFCIQPSELAPGVKTFAELEVLQFLKQISDGDTSILVIDSRTPNFHSKLVGLLVNSIYKYALVAFGLVMALSQLGVNMGGAIAGLGVVGIAIGLAAQDTLSNTIAGFTIFWDKPFVVGDWVTASGQYGKVQDITLRSVVHAVWIIATR